MLIYFPVFFIVFFVWFPIWKWENKWATRLFLFFYSLFKSFVTIRLFKKLLFNNRLERNFSNIKKINIWFYFKIFLLDIDVRGIGEGREDGNSSVPTPPGSDDDKPREYFTFFLQKLLQIFATDRNLLEDRGPFIIR